jgi:hypothetical protein
VGIVRYDEDASMRSVSGQRIQQDSREREIGGAEGLVDEENLRVGDDGAEESEQLRLSPRKPHRALAYQGVPSRGKPG